MGYHEDLFRIYKFANPKGYRNLKKTSRRRDNVLLDSGYYSTQAWGALNKCWKGFKIAKSEFDMKNMFHYAKGIRRLQWELNISVSEFPRFGLIGRITVAEEEQQNLPGRSYTQTQNEFENYELQDPFRIQREPDLTEELVFQNSISRRDMVFLSDQP
ncbi:MAG: hypothetical protein WA667_19825 [Candidatus Nitrosopolaris sp.]